MTCRHLRTPQSIIYFCTIITICSLYAAQPIQPVFQREFGLSQLQAILFTTLIMTPLGIAPLIYGFLLESFSAKILVRAAVLLLGCLEIFFALSDDYLSLLIIRGLQGLLIPAILTSLMSYVSLTSEPHEIQQSIGFYISSTIMGGFLGRFLSGLFTDLFGWRFFFFVLGLLLIVAFLLLGKLTRDVSLRYARPSRKDVAILLGSKHTIWLYLTIFCVFFAFAALMNFLPFRLKELNSSFTESGIGVIYLGYSMGIVASLNVRRIIKFFGNEIRAAQSGILIFAAGTLLFLVTDPVLLFGAMFVFCFGMFTVHALLSGYVNTIVIKNKSLANGFYISFYYTGGSLGSVLPGYAYAQYGWNGFLAVLLLVLCFAWFCIRKLGTGQKNMK
ncbi:MAG: MFS transporter [Proteobacteria bacterium]|nr:MFS transporter [Pseudomonadota bacterium]MBU1059279.1 MFS transporter [Pseudomonadota bacterium]